ncbi:hypothetical protein Hypma_000067 [Hypsizygus marmoreus]|uniref:HNH nuclease domain-containing protein n=1 Tax=Hypsizygus marmoreus TaxID=39966 RepID=A0A369KJI4_HYPMA|nr:hypothetical protein Hypma_000067 [Hypsizygus marmoreus]
MTRSTPAEDQHVYHRTSSMIPTTHPLPANPFIPSSSNHDAYRICLNLEERAGRTNLHPPSLSFRQLAARFLGYLILEAPTSEGREYLVESIRESGDDEPSLVKLALEYMRHIARCFHFEDQTLFSAPSTPEGSEPHAFGTTEDCLRCSLDSAHADETTLRHLALIRDEYRCVLTGIYDMDSFLKREDVREMVQDHPRPDPGVARTTATKIISYQPNPTVAEENILSFLACFGGIDLAPRNQNPKAQGLENLVTMSLDKHYMFQALSIWLESTETPHRYKLGAIHPLFLRNLPEYVTLSSSHPAELPLPSPAYLNFHAACARATHLSGARKFLTDTVGRIERALDAPNELLPAQLLDVVLATLGSVAS